MDKSWVSNANRSRALARPASALQMEDVEAAWVGAFIEGEGCVRRGGGNRRMPQMVVGSTSVESISTLLRLTGTGRVHYNPQAGKNKPFWKWVVSRRNDFLKIAYQISPYLTDKREELAESVRVLKEDYGGSS